MDETVDLIEVERRQGGVDWGMEERVDLVEMGEEGSGRGGRGRRTEDAPSPPGSASAPATIVPPMYCRCTACRTW